MWRNSLISEAGRSCKCLWYALYQMIIVENRITKKGIQKPTSNKDIKVFLLIYHELLTKVYDLAPMEPPVVPGHALHHPAVLSVQGWARPGQRAVRPERDCLTSAINLVIAKTTSYFKNIAAVQHKTIIVKTTCKDYILWKRYLAIHREAHKIYGLQLAVRHFPLVFKTAISNDMRPKKYESLGPISMNCFIPRVRKSV